MIYNEIDKDLISLGEAKQVFGKSKHLTPVYYDGGSLEFTERNRYVRVNGIETTQYNKRQIIIKSKAISKMVEDIISKLNEDLSKKIISPVFTDGSVRLNVNKDTRFNNSKRKPIKDNLDNSLFSACVSISVPTVFTDSERSTVQLVLSECVIIEIKESLEIDFDELKVAD
jgi:Family of unknown function (DUF5482)